MSSDKKLRVLGLILARGGSKRLPGKNLLPILGKPLISWTIEASLACPLICQTVVSTDSQAIADVALAAGSSVPFLRPAELARDESSSADAALHALQYLFDLEAQAFDVVVLLEPTSPLRASSDLKGVIELFSQQWENTDAVVTVGAVGLEQPDVMKCMDEDGFISPWLAAVTDAKRLQSRPLFPYGVAYAIKVSALQKWRSFYPPRVVGYPLERWQNYEVDDAFDFVCVASIMAYMQERTT